MTRLFTLLLLPTLFFCANNSVAQFRPDTAQKTVDLNEFVVRQSGQKVVEKTRRLRYTSLLIPAESTGRRKSWDSVMLLTRFPAPSPKSMILHSVSSRLAALDTSKLDLFLVILQLHENDTLFHRIPVTPDLMDADGKRFTIDLRDSVLSLQAAPFYLGFAFRTKPNPENYSFPFYYTRGGQGAVLSFLKRRWTFISQSNPIYIFPFQMKYAEGY